MSDAPTELVHYDVADQVATITLDSPHNRNALSRQLVTELFARLEAADADDDVKVVVIRAEGKVFCSGADLSEASADGMEEGARAMVAMQRQIVALSKPVVTRLHGAVRAGGIGIVAASDIAIAADDTTFALTEVKLGLAPAVISLTVLPRLTSRAAALTCLTGEVFDGAEAAEMGLVTRAVARRRAGRRRGGGLRLAGDRRAAGTARDQGPAVPRPARPHRRRRRRDGGAQRPPVRVGRGARGDGGVPVAEEVAARRTAQIASRFRSAASALVK